MWSLRVTLTGANFLLPTFFLSAGCSEPHDNKQLDDKLKVCIRNSKYTNNKNKEKN